MGLDLHFQRLHLSRPVEGGAELHFSLPPGSALVVVGRNGSGKSTLLNTLAGLLAPRSGEVRLGERNVMRMSARDRATWMSLVTSTPAKPNGLTVGDVMALGAAAGGQVDAPTRSVEAMVDAGIAQWRDQPLSTLSDGMAQRVMVARAGLQSNAVMLLDEPTAFLDIVGKDEVLGAVGRWRGAKRTVILTTHDVEAVAEAGWSTHWLHLHPGREGGATLHTCPVEVEAVRSAIRGDRT